MNEADANTMILLLAILILVSLAIVFLRWKPTLPKLKKDKEDGGDHGINATPDDNKVTQLIATGVLTLVAVAGFWWYNVDLSTLVNNNPLIALTMFIGLVTVMWCVVAFLLKPTITWAIPTGGAILIGSAIVGVLAFVIGPDVMFDWLKSWGTWLTGLFDQSKPAEKISVDGISDGTWTTIGVIAVLILGLAMIFLPQKKGD